MPYVMCPSCQKVGHTAASLHAGPSLCPRCGALLPARRTVVPLSRYPIRRVLRLAGMAIERDADNLDDLVAHLDDNEVIRFWAAQGILMLGDAGQPAVEALSDRLERDASVHVRVVVAEALARLGHTGRPVDFLAATIDSHENPRVRLQALNAFTYVGVAALRHMPVVERAATSSDEYLRNAGRYLRFVLTGTYTPASPVFGGF